MSSESPSEIVIRTLQPGDDIARARRIVLSGIWEVQEFRRLLFYKPITQVLFIILMSTSGVLLLQQPAFIAAVIKLDIQNSWPCSLYKFLQSHLNQSGLWLNVCVTLNAWTSSIKFEPVSLTRVMALEGGLISLTVACFLSAAVSYLSVCLFVRYQVYRFFTWYEASCMDDMADPIKYYSAQGKSFLIAEEAGLIVGTVAMDTITDVSNACELRRMDVVSTHRRRNIATKLLNAFEKKALEGGFHKIVLYTSEVQTTAHALYERNGFELTGEKSMDFVIGTGLGIYKFEKVLLDGPTKIIYS